MSSLKGNGVVGIRREDKNKWERRVPLSPEQVRALVNSGVRVIIQPSNIRIYPNEAYLEAGAELAEDLSPASTILAVKEVPIHLLMPERTYLFFSHTIKAQPYNMPLLDALLEKKIRMIDYECITQGGIRGGKRLVAFGRFAGIAGMVDFLRGCGERFLSLGYSTPFLNVAAMYMYRDVAAAKQAVAACGEAIAKYGLPADICPFTAVFTGDGNVSKGAQEIFSLLPVKWVDPFELKNIQANAKGKERTHCVYAAVATERHMVRRKRERSGSVTTPSAGSASKPPVSSALAGLLSSPLGIATSAAQSEAADLEWREPETAETFNKAHYKAEPDQYEPLFHSNVAPFASTIINCMYWEPRFPRLLSIKQTQSLHKAGKLKGLMGVCDISCDFQGSIEFLKEFTSIEAPFYIYEPKEDKVLHDLEAPGILFHAVDHLPSECPRDASDHFGSCLAPFVRGLAFSDGLLPFEKQTDIPNEMKGAVICDHGALTPNFDYIARLRAANERANASRGIKMKRAESFLTVDLIGHLFDTGMISKVLDAIEDSSTSAHIVDFKLGKDRDTPTELRLQLFNPGHNNANKPAAKPGGSTPGSITPSASGTNLAGMVASPSSTSSGAAAAAQNSFAKTLATIQEIAAGTGVQVKVEGEESYIHEAVNAAKVVERSLQVPAKRILVLGAGFVSAPLVEYLHRRSGNHITLASMIKEEAVALAQGRTRIEPIQLDVGKETERLESLVASHDIVVSLVPAPCHPPIAKLCISHGKHMVTASYVAPEMKALHEAAAKSHITILNEAGLDPGMDHMSAMKLIDDARAAGGVITKFSSVCGGLPAPEASNNPLGYKFSWSPRGALVATRNSAKYLSDGKLVEVPGEALLTSAVPFRVNPAFALECIPNRDSVPYASKYGIEGPHLKTMFRGTLRYKGFCGSMHALTALGLFDVDERQTMRGISLRGLLAQLAGLVKVEPGLTAGDLYAQAAAVTDDALFAAVLKIAAEKASSLVAAQVDRLTALSPAMGEAAKAGASACTNAGIATDPLKQAELRQFFEWCGLLNNNQVAPLRGGASGDGINGPKTELAVAAEVEAGTYFSLSSSAPVQSFVPIDTLVALLTAKPEMSYDKGERDMALMQHDVEVFFPPQTVVNPEDGTSVVVPERTEKHTSTLVEYADLAKNRTAMARTVGFTAAIGAQLILDGKVGSTGVVVPMTPEWYVPMLEALEGEGITFKHTIKQL